MFVDLFFFFKQKTAYEMRISDWSSDVCSSDLEQVTLDAIVAAFGVDRGDRHRGFVVRHQNALPAAVRSARILGPAVDAAPRPEINRHIVGRRDGDARSEEHTSELQSLMRNSYAVFCLNKKKSTKHNNNTKK